MKDLQRLRARRTRLSNVVKHGIEWMLGEPAKWACDGRPVGPDFRGIPSWWPFWSDVLKSNTVDLVRATRDLAKAEGQEL